MKRGFVHIYPDVIAAAWEPADRVANRVAERLIAQHGWLAAMRERVLPEEHFEFRGGVPDSVRPAGRRTRLGEA